MKFKERLQQYKEKEIKPYLPFTKVIYTLRNLSNVKSVKYKLHGNEDKDNQANYSEIRKIGDIIVKLDYDRVKTLNELLKIEKDILYIEGQKYRVITHYNHNKNYLSSLYLELL